MVKFLKILEINCSLDWLSYELEPARVLPDLLSCLVRGLSPLRKEFFIYEDVYEMYFLAQLILIKPLFTL